MSHNCENVRFPQVYDMETINTYMQSQY